jgi:hypothetical protein
MSEDKKYVVETISITPKGKWCYEQSLKGKTKEEQRLLWTKAVNEYDKLFDKNGKKKVQ